jgi:hypothetical protein
MRKFLMGAAFAAFAGLAGQASASTNLIVNGSFETGDFTGWTQGGKTSGTDVFPSGFDGMTAPDGVYVRALSRAHFGNGVAVDGTPQLFCLLPRHRSRRSAATRRLGEGLSRVQASRAVLRR